MPEPNPIQEYDLLLIEDERDVAELTLYYLKRCGFRSILASSLSEAKALLETHRFRAALVDLRLPDGDGSAFIRELRHHHAIPIAIATSASREPEVDELSKDAGADAFLSKPYGLSEIRECLEEILSLKIEEKEPSSGRVLKVQIGDLDPFRSAGDNALQKRKTEEFLHAVHHMTNESFALQFRAAALRFSDAEEAAREQDWAEAAGFWTVAWQKFEQGL